MKAAKLCGPTAAELIAQVAEAGLRLALTPPDRLRLLGTPNPPAEILAELRRIKPQVLALLTLHVAERDPEHWANLDTWVARMAEHETLAVREHRCECGCVLDRDVAAARVILHRAGWEQPGTGCGAPSERVAA